MAIKGLEQAVENLSRISRAAVPGAAAMAINRVASSAISQSASQVARETKVRRKLVKERARLKRATVKNPQARIKVNRGDLPVIKLGNARIVLSDAGVVKGAAFSPERWRQRACGGKPSYSRRVYSATNMAAGMSCSVWPGKTVTPLMW